MKNFYRIWQYKKSLIVVFCIALILITFALYSKNNLLIGTEVQNNYKHEFVILNKSFKRDLDRSEILYKSFEKYFIDAEKIPFFIVIPARDWRLFLDRFNTLKLNNEIKEIPHFITEQEVFQRCGDEDVSDEGNMAQQVVKLCFGSTKIAKNYLMIDSDNYFLKKFDYKLLFDKENPKTISWKLPKSVIENNKDIYLTHGISPILRNVDSISAYGTHIYMKGFFGNNSTEQYGFVISPFLFNSDFLFRMKSFINKKGGYRFSHLIKLIPFEMQWYGEYVLQHEKFIPKNAIFTHIGSPEECHAEIPNDDSYGFWFQSVIYTKDSMKNNPQLIYKRPKHCDTAN